MPRPRVPSALTSRRPGRARSWRRCSRRGQYGDSAPPPESPQPHRCPAAADPRLRGAWQQAGREVMGFGSWANRRLRRLGRNPEQWDSPRRVAEVTDARPRPPMSQRRSAEPLGAGVLCPLPHWTVPQKFDQKHQGRRSGAAGRTSAPAAPSKVNRLFLKHFLMDESMLNSSACRFREVNL